MTGGRSTSRRRRTDPPACTASARRHRTPTRELRDDAPRQGQSLRTVRRPVDLPPRTRHAPRVQLEDVFADRDEALRRAVTPRARATGRRFVVLVVSSPHAADCTLVPLGRLALHSSELVQDGAALRKFRHLRGPSRHVALETQDTDMKLVRVLVDPYASKYERELVERYFCATQVVLGTAFGHHLSSSPLALVPTDGTRSSRAKVPASTAPTL